MGRAQKHEIKQSFEGLLGLLSAWLNLPPPNKRLIRAGTRNFASTGRLVEESISDAADAGYRAFQINFEGFKPGSMNEDGVRKVRDAASGLRLTCRLPDFPSYPPEQADQVLRDAAVFAIEAGVQGISLPARGLDPARAEMIVRAAKWAKEEALRRNIPLPDVLFSVENTWREDWGEWNMVSPEVLRDYFAGQPVGLCLWLDSFRTWNPDGPLYYVDTARLKLSTAYVGDDFFQNQSLFERARILLVEMRRRHWNGDLIGQSIVPVPDAKSDLEREEFKVAFLNRLIAEAYLPEDTSASLRNSGELVGSPSMETRPPLQEAGLEEVLAVPSAVQANVVHVLDPANADVGLFLGKTQQDPVVILAADSEEDRLLRHAGFVGDNRIVLLVSSFDSIKQARAAAAALFPTCSPRFYQEGERSKLKLWLAWVLERYDISGLTVEEAAAVIETLSVLKAA